jgi:hypothetical protein
MTGIVTWAKRPRILLPLILVAIVVAGVNYFESTTRPAIECGPPPTIGPEAALPPYLPHTVTGCGPWKSEPINLKGDYTITWSATTIRPDSCDLYADLERVDGQPFGETQARYGGLVTDRFTGGGPWSGTTAEYNLDDTAWFVNGGLPTTCNWTFTFTPS